MTPSVPGCCVKSPRASRHRSHVTRSPPAPPSRDPAGISHGIYCPAPSGSVEFHAPVFGSIKV